MTALIDCEWKQAPEILAIFNHEIVHTTGLYDYKPRTLAAMETWFENKRKGNYPVLGLVDDNGTLLAFASYGTFRAWPAYKYSVEHSIYVHRDHRRRGFGKRLLEELIAAGKRQGYHTLIGVIDSQNHGSVQLHTALGFSHCGTIKEAGYKFGSWRDVFFYQLILSTPENPTEG